MKKVLIILAILVLLLSVFACQPASDTGGGKKSIVVTYSILGAIIKDLVGDQANITISIPDGLDPHDWEPSARDIETINYADLVIQNGLGLESAMLKTLEAARSSGVKSFVASDYINVRHVGPGEGIPSHDPDQVLGAADPHLWMDPLTITSVVMALAPVLKTDLNLDVFSRATVLGKRLENLNQEVAGIISAIPPGNRKLVTGHESMGYFARRYGFKLVGVIIPGLSSQASVSASDLAALKKAIEENQVKAIFTELGTSPAIARAIGDETGVKVVALTTHTLPADGSYFTFMMNMADVITGALQ